MTVISKYEEKEVGGRVMKDRAVNVPSLSSEHIDRLSKVLSWTWQTQVQTGPDPKCLGPGPDMGGPGPEL